MNDQPDIKPRSRDVTDGLERTAARGMLRAVGMTEGQTMRRIILPQATRTAIPPMSNTLVSLIKDTSLTSIILVTEVVAEAKFAAASTFQYMTMFGLAAFYFWIICLVVSFLQDRVEERTSRYVAV